MNKSEMKDYIIENFKNIERIILLTQLDYLKDKKFYGWKHNGKKMKLINIKNQFTINEV